MTNKTIKPFLAGLIVLFLGTFVVTFFDIYNFIPHIDKFLHVAGGFVVAWFFSNYWGDDLRGLSGLQRFIILMSLASFIGSFWEVMEYSTSTSFFEDNQLIRHYIYGGDLFDTLADIMADISGAAILFLFKR
ncbi:MAG: hypothetical protein Q8P69_00645 [bacterium]|nr:hypothetical protein [bacterium]